MQALMLHGAGGGAWEWNVWRRVFVAAGHEVRCPDLHPIEAGVEATRFEDYVQQVERAAEGGVDVAVGASLGGLLALALASRRRLRALILVNPMPPAPEAARLAPRAAYPPRIPWAREASLAGTCAALPEADPSAWHFAFRRWRDESGAVMNAARAGVALAAPACPVALLASQHDADVPFDVSAALARRLDSTLWSVPGSHVGPLLGPHAAAHAQAAVHWLNGLARFRTD